MNARKLRELFQRSRRQSTYRNDRYRNGSAALFSGSDAGFENGLCEERNQAIRTAFSSSFHPDDVGAVEPMDDEIGIVTAIDLPPSAAKRVAHLFLEISSSSPHSSSWNHDLTPRALSSTNMAMGIHVAMSTRLAGPRKPASDERLRLALDHDRMRAATMIPLIARLLQLSGMIILPIGLIYGLGYGDIRTEVKLLALGGFLFVLGWILGREKNA